MDYFRAALVIAPQIFAGCLIYLLLLKRTEVAAIELLSIGFAIGITASTICDQIFVNLNWPKIGWLLPLFVSIFVGSYILWAKKIVLARVAWQGELKKTFFPVVSIATIALGTEWFWLFPSGIFLVIAATLMYFPKFGFQKIATRMSLLASVVAMYIMVSTRPKIWWMLEENDYPFLQALSSSIANWGPSDYFLQTGSPLKYHWFIYAWVGLVERSAKTEPYLVLTRISPAIFTLLITGIIWTVFNNFSDSSRKKLAFTFVVMMSSSYPLWGGGMKITTLSSPSQYYAFIFLIASLHFLILTSRDSLRLATLLSSIFAAATILTKAPHGFVLVSGIVFHLGSIFFYKNTQKHQIIKVEVSMLFVALSTYLLFVSGPGFENSAAFQFGGFLWQIQGEVRLAPTLYVFTFGILTVISLSLIPFLIFLSGYLTNQRNPEHFYYFGLGSIAFGSSVAILVIANYGENLYFLHAAVVISNIVGLFSLIESDNLRLPKLSFNFLLIPLGVSICIASFFIPNINSGSKVAIISRSMRPVFGSLIILTYVTFICISRRRNIKHIRATVFQVLLVAISMSITFSFANWIILMPTKSDEFKRNGLTYLPNQDVLDVAGWIRNNSELKDIVASNFGWPLLKNDELKYFTAPCTSFKDKSVVEESCRRTSNAQLVVYLGRRSWLQTTTFQYSNKNDVAEKRQRTILNFAQNPDQKTYDLLHSGGVDWFVVDRSTTSLESWLPFAEIKFTSDSFFVLKI
jgi:hypothetical protein